MDTVTGVTAVTAFSDSNYMRVRVHARVTANNAILPSLLVSYSRTYYYAEKSCNTCNAQEKRS